MNIDGMMQEYMQEKLGREIFSNRDGFITFYFRAGGNLHISDMYISKERRRTGAGTELLNDFISQVCRENNMSLLTASCDMTLKNPELSLQSILGYTNTKEDLKFKVMPEDTIVNFYMELPYGTEG